MRKIFLLFIFTLMITGCEDEIDIPVLSDSEEIERYIADDELGRTFFSKANLISEKSYTFPFDSTGYYVDIKDSIDREINTKFPLKIFGAGYSDPIQDFGPPFGESQDAEVHVRDRVYAHTIRVEGVDTTVMNELIYRDFNRYGYFMKLGNDGQRFSGWLLRGFSGGLADAFTDILYSGNIYHENNQIFSYRLDNYNSVIQQTSTNSIDTIKVYQTDREYKLLNGDALFYALVERVGYGEVVRAEYTTNTQSIFQTMLYNNGDSIILQNFDSVGSSKYQAIVSLSSNSSKTWDFLYFQEFYRLPSDTSAIPRFQTLERRNWVVPVKYE